MYYCLNNDVYLVKGKFKDCIYDLYNKKLYHIQKEISDLIERVCSVDINKLNLTDDENKAIKDLKIACLIDTSDEIKQFLDIKNLDTDFNIKFVWIEVCTFCNLKCKHCYNESSAQCNETMSFDDFKKVCQELIDIGVRKVQLIGGEPFCNKNIKEMLKYATERFEFVEIFTNGILINEEWCEFLKENNIHVAMSIYSYDAREHDKVTLQKGSHAKTTHSVELLKQYEIPHRIATVYMKGLSVGKKRNGFIYNKSEKRCNSYGRQRKRRASHSRIIKTQTDNKENIFAYFKSQDDCMSRKRKSLLCYKTLYFSESASLSLCHGT